MDTEQTKEARRRPGVRGVGLVLLVAVTLSLGYIAGTRSDTIMASIGPVFGIRVSDKVLDFSSVNDVYQQLDANFDGELDTDALLEGAKAGLVAAAGDRHTVYLTATEATNFQDQLNGKVSGIGAEIGTRGGEPTILRLIDDSPAKASGLQPRDTIIQVNDAIVTGMLPGDVAEKIRGDIGTTVKLVVKRNDEQLTFTITRAEVSDPSVASRVEDGIGYLTIRRFDNDTAALSQQAATLFVEKNVRGVIVDLRDDSGGYLDGARQVAGLWLHSDEIVTTETRQGEQIDVLYGSASPILRDIPTAVLVNGGSASASEVLTGALGYYDRATIIGETTYGKGTIQQVLTTSGGGELKVTIARWNLPDGTNIDETGITPDTEVTLSAEDLDADRDPQLVAAQQMFK